MKAVKKPNQTVSEDNMLAWFDGKVASWWKPDAVIFVEQLPHTATGGWCGWAGSNRYLFTMAR